VPEPHDDPGKALYVHLASDGGIFVVRGESGEQAWIGEDELFEELAALRERGGRLLYSRDAPESDPTPALEALFLRIMDTKPPAVQLVDEPHPDALKGPGS
jgi:hypothetical protein